MGIDNELTPEEIEAMTSEQMFLPLTQGDRVLGLVIKEPTIISNLSPLGDNMNPNRRLRLNSLPIKKTIIPCNLVIDPDDEETKAQPLKLITYIPLDQIQDINATNKLINFATAGLNLSKQKKIDKFFNAICDYQPSELASKDSLLNILFTHLGNNFHLEVPVPDNEVSLFTGRKENFQINPYEAFVAEFDQILIRADRQQTRYKCRLFFQHTPNGYISIPLDDGINSSMDQKLTIPIDPSGNVWNPFDKFEIPLSEELNAGLTAIYNEMLYSTDIINVMGGFIGMVRVEGYNPHTADLILKAMK